MEIQTTWKLKLNDNLTVQVSTDTWLELGPYDCEAPLIGILAEICSHTGTTPVYSIIISISDGYEIITHTWSVQYDVWHPPEPEPIPVPTPEPEPEEGDGDSSASGGTEIETDTRVIIGLAAIVVVLGAIVLITGRKKSQPPPMQAPPTDIPKMIGESFRR